MSWDQWDPVTGRRKRWRRPTGRFAWIGWGIIIVPAVCLIAIAAFIVGALVISGHINSERETKTCEVTAVTDAPRADSPDWKIGTDCGGTLYIDPDATHQTDQQASDLANSLAPGNRYVLKIQGNLDNKFTISSYLLAATMAK